jgi:hypothetical protein
LEKINSAGRRPKRVVQQRPEGEEAPLVGLAMGVYSTGVGGRGDKMYFKFLMYFINLQQNTWAEKCILEPTKFIFTEAGRQAEN